jgi:hypothetical protein
MSYITNLALFYISEITTTIPAVGTVTQNKAFPSQGLINVLKDFPWKISGSTEEVPNVLVTEYELSWGQTVTNIQRSMQLIAEEGGKRTDPYYAMYSGKQTGFKYVFPHLIKDGQSLRKVSHNWSHKADTTMSGVTQLLGGLADGAAGILANAGTQFIPGIGGMIRGAQDALLGPQIATNVLPGVGAEEVRKYSGTTPLNFTIKFPLYNTIDTASAYKNYSLVTLLTFQNLKTRTSFMSYIPPKLYRVENTYKGGVFIPVSFISNLDIKSIGTTRVLKEYGDVLIPEGYDIEITFQELISQSSNIFEGTMGGNKIEVIASPLTLETNFRDLATNIKDFIEKK